MQYVKFIQTPKTNSTRRNFPFQIWSLLEKTIYLFQKSTEWQFRFLLDGKSKLSGIQNIDGKALGVGLANLIFSISSIRLDEIYWPEVIANSTSLNLKVPEQKELLTKELPKK